MGCSSRAVMPLFRTQPSVKVYLLVRYWLIDWVKLLRPTRATVTVVVTVWPWPLTSGSMYASYRVYVYQVWSWYFMPFLANVNSRSCLLYAKSPSVVCLSPVTFVYPTQPAEIFGNVSTPFSTLAIRWHSLKILRTLCQGTPSVGEFKCKRDSQI